MTFIRKNWIKVVRSPDDTHLVGENGERFNFSEVPNSWPEGIEVDGWIQLYGDEWGLFKRIAEDAS